MVALSRCLGFLALFLVGADGERIARKRKPASSSVQPQADGVHVVVSPQVTNLRPVGVVMNPGGLVEAGLYEDSLRRWQAEAEKNGISLWFAILGYWFNLPIPINTKKNVNNGISAMRGAGLPANGPVLFSGHSMGGGAPLPIVQELYDEGVLSGVVLQAAFITRSFFPPVTADLAFTAPTLTVGAELNFATARITRFAEAVYRQPEATHPVVIIEGMNHGQFFTGGSFEDIKPEISHVEAQEKQAKIVIDWLRKFLGMGSGSFLRSEVARTKTLVQPLITAFELEGSRAFNVPNQVGTPNWECPRGVCPQGSPWVAEMQAYMAGKNVMDSGVQIQNSFADLFPFSGGDREGRKPFVSGDTIQAYVMASNSAGGLGDQDGGDFTEDTQPFATGELLAKFVSRQNAGKKLLGRDLPADTDICQELNQQAYNYALQNAGAKTRQRFDAHGEKMKMVATGYTFAGPLWVYSQMSLRSRGGVMEVKSQGLFTGLGSKEIDGNHYCKLLSPAKAMEWVYVDGLTPLLGDWQ